LSERDSPQRITGGKHLVWLLGLTFFYLFVSLFVRLRIPILLSDDQVFFWSYAHRILNREHPYKDFFQFTTPGTDLVYAGLFQIFGERLWVTNLVVLLLGLTLTYMCFQIAQQLLAPRFALLAAILFAVPFYGELLNATHHWFSTLSVLAAVLVLFKRQDSKAVLIAGALLGLASFFTQTRGVFGLAGIGIWLATENGRDWKRMLRQEAMLSVAFVMVLAILEAPFIVNAGFQQVWFQQVTYVQHHVVRHSLGLPEGFTLLKLPHLIQYLFPYVLLPLIYPTALVISWRPENSFTHTKIRLLALVGVFLFLEVALSPNFLRIYTISMPALILFVWWLTHVRIGTRLIVPLVWIFICGTLALQVWRLWRTEYVVLDLPAGRTAISKLGAEQLLWASQNTRQGEWLYQPAWPAVYFPMQLRNPAFLDEVTANFMTPEPEFIDRSLHQVETRRTRFVIWSKRLDPLPSGASDQLLTLRTFLQSQYRVVHTFSDGDEVWERNPQLQ
jgi:hypothetical protein